MLLPFLFFLLFLLSALPLFSPLFFVTLLLLFLSHLVFFLGPPFGLLDPVIEQLQTARVHGIWVLIPNIIHLGPAITALLPIWRTHFKFYYYYTINLQSNLI